ncbi:HEAT repeat domain-containing protein [Rummeliibacillus pycnus]|uniref:HEAT repeat domain-containing protein n=1 Tax=Rummeliibacillus pycnus TaxID=101070 RepID=UPI0037C9C8F7
MSEILLLTIVVFCIVVIVACCSIYLIYSRLLQNKDEKNVQKYVSELLPQCYHYFIEGSSIETLENVHNPYQVKAIEIILTKYIHLLNDQDVVKRITQYVEKNLSEHYKKNLKSRRWGIRLNALFKILDFKIQTLAPSVLELLNSSRKFSQKEYFEMYKVIALFLPEHLMSQLKNSTDRISNIELYKVLALLKEDTIKEIMQAFSSLTQSQQIAVIDTIASKSMLEYTDFLHELIKDENIEIRIHAMKAIEQIGFIQPIETYEPFFYADDWRERMLFAKILKYFPLDEIIDYLKVLVTDPSWWVRHHTVQMITDQKNGEKVLKLLYEQTDDLYARDIILESLGA